MSEEPVTFAHIVNEARFLCARIDDLDFSQDMETFSREHAGHVDPSHYRLKALLAKVDDNGIDVWGDWHERYQNVVTALEEGDLDEDMLSIMRATFERHLDHLARKIEGQRD